MKNSFWIKYYKDGVKSETLTFRDFEKRVNKMRDKLISLKIENKDRVLVQLGNSPDAIVAYFALYRIGAIVVPIGELEDQERTNYIIDDCDAKAMISNEEIFLFEERGKKKPTGEISTIIYTSGTTGVPKGVCLSWENWESNAKSIINHHKINRDTVFASPLPLNHCNAHGMAMIATYLVKCKLILFNKVTPNFLKIIAKENVNILSVVPPILYKLFDYQKNWNPPKSLSHIITAAAPLSEDLLEKINTGWKTKVVQGYGLSESTNFSCTLPVNLNKDSYNQIMFPHPSVGIALNGVKIEVGEKNKEREVGEIFISSPSNFNGYWKKGPIKRRKTVDTGDLGYYKKFKGQKYYYLIGRKKELINRGGEKISPVEIESELRRTGLSGKFAVIPIEDKKHGEEIGLVCCKKPDNSSLEKIPYYRRPKKIFYTKELPYTATGKLQRKKLTKFFNEK